MDKYPVLKFDSLKHLQSEIKANDWEYSDKNHDTLTLMICTCKRLIMDELRQLC